MTKNFTIEEFLHSATAYKLHISNNPDLEQMASLQELAIHLLQPLRDRYGKPITITSGYRCKALNSLLRGADHSQHLRGEAADITSADNRRLLAILKELPYDQLIPYRDKADGTIVWIHVSCCPKPRRQVFCKYI